MQADVRPGERRFAAAYAENAAEAPATEGNNSTCEASACAAKGAVRPANSVSHSGIRRSGAVDGAGAGRGGGPRGGGGSGRGRGAVRFGRVPDGRAAGSRGGGEGSAEGGGGRGCSSGGGDSEGGGGGGDRSRDGDSARGSELRSAVSAKHKRFPGGAESGPAYLFRGTPSGRRTGATLQARRCASGVADGESRRGCAANQVARLALASLKFSISMNWQSRMRCIWFGPPRCCATEGT